MSGDADIRLIAALLGGLIAIGLWLIARIYEIWTERRRLETMRRNFIRALYAEINFNISDMNRFLSHPLTPALEAALRDNNTLIPHVVDASHTTFYRSNISDLHYVSDALIGKIVHFYGTLERMTSQIEGLDKPSFLSISGDGRVTAVERIFDSVEECKSAGESLLIAIAGESPHLDLERTKGDHFDRSDG